MTFDVDVTDSSGSGNSTVIQHVNTMHAGRLLGGWHDFCDGIVVVALHYKYQCHQCFKKSKKVLDFLVWMQEFFQAVLVLSLQLQP